VSATDLLPFPDLPPFEDKPPALVEAFWSFHESNPQVYGLIDRFTRQAIAAGRERFGMKAVFERIRWYTTVETQGETFKLNNNYTSFYARLWMHRNPTMPQVFALRKSVADDGAAT